MILLTWMINYTSETPREKIGVIFSSYAVHAHDLNLRQTHVVFSVVENLLKIRLGFYSTQIPYKAVIQTTYLARILLWKS
jgi:hypothetical protein